MFSRHLAAAAALALIGAAPLAAAAQNASAAPVAVQNCSVAPGAPLLPEFTNARWADGLAVRLANGTSKVVTSVELGTSYGSQSEDVVVNRQLAANESGSGLVPAYSTTPFVGASATCSVQKVSFADGTTWQPSTTVSSSPAVTAARR